MTERELKNSISEEYARLLSEAGIEDQGFLGLIASWYTMGSDTLYLNYLKGYSIQNLEPKVK